MQRGAQNDSTEKNPKARSVGRGAEKGQTDPTAFTEQEEKLLEKGLKFAVPPLHPDKARDYVMADLMVGLSRKSELAADQCAEVLKNHPIDEAPPNTKAIIKSLKRKVKDGDLIVTKADKGNSTVVMDRTAYDEKIMTFINDNSGKKIDFNFCKFAVDVRRRIMDSELIIPPEKKQRLLSMNPDYTACPRYTKLIPPSGR
jgi:hypothetical protein